MSEIHIEVSEVIDAAPDKIYGVISDYKVGHPAILPKPYFTELTVLKGGVGAGTEVRVGMQVMGIKKVYHQVVSEPEPGRVLVEDDATQGVITHFTIEPLNGGTRSRVTISTDMRASPGVVGFMEKLINPPITRSIYKKELQKLAAYVKAK